MATPMNGDTGASRKPKDTKFKQQKLPAWQPIMTAGTVLPAFFAIGIAFIPLGVALLITSNNVKEITVDYTDNCTATTTNEYDNCGAYLDAKRYSGLSCTCYVNFTIEHDIKGEVYMYYGLTNYYQNHRRYVKSRDDNQLAGKAVSTIADVSQECEPYRGYLGENMTEAIPYAPCGAIANSLFNDTLSVVYLGDENTERNITLPLTKSNIAWSTDRNVKFKNPPSFAGTIKPPNWKVNVTTLSPEGYDNEDLIVWMRTAALPTFRKLYRRVERDDVFKEGLPRGNYMLQVQYNYPVKMFDGSKRMILSTTSWLGGKNPFLGVAYLVVGSICIILGIIFLVIHLKVGKKPTDMVQNVNNRTEY